VIDDALKQLRNIIQARSSGFSMCGQRAHVSRFWAIPGDSIAARGSTSEGEVAGQYESKRSHRGV
jgi:hypothetical protein